MAGTGTSPIRWSGKKKLPSGRACLVPEREKQPETAGKQTHGTMPNARESIPVGT
jgi:hypothetical protein